MRERRPLWPRPRAVAVLLLASGAQSRMLLDEGAKSNTGFLYSDAEGPAPAPLPPYPDFRQDVKNTWASAAPSPAAATAPAPAPAPAVSPEGRNGPLLDALFSGRVAPPLPAPAPAPAPTRAPRSQAPPLKLNVTLPKFGGVQGRPPSPKPSPSPAQSPVRSRLRCCHQRRQRRRIVLRSFVLHALQAAE